MSNLAQKREQEAPTEPQQEPATIYDISHGKSRYRKQYIAYDNIERANKPKNATAVTSVAGEKAQKVVSVVAQKIKGRRKEFIANLNYIAKITGKKRRQNINIINQINGTAFNVTSHKKYKNHRNCYVFTHLEKVVKIDESKVQNFAQLELLQTAEISYSQVLYKNNNTESIRYNVHTHESNFLQNSEEVISDKNNTTQIIELAKEPVKPAKFKKRLPNERKKPTRGELKARIYKPFAYSKPKTLSDMLPLIDGSTCDELRSKSGRPFSDNFITQLVLKMSRDHRLRPVFNYRSGFISYMVKALKHELHDAVKTGNIGFRFKANIPVNNNENQERESRSVALKPEPIELPKGEWGDICRRLIDIYDEHIYRNWLSKLIIFLDERDKFITLEAPSSFMKEWIETNYWDSIKKIAESMGLELRGISTQACLKGERVFAYGTTSEKVIENLPGESTSNGFQKVSVFEIVDKLQKS